MRKDQLRLLGGAAAIAFVAALGGFGVAQFAGGQPSASGEAAQGEEGHAEEAGEAEAPEGVVQITPAQQEASGITVVAVGRGGGGETRLSGRIEPMVDAKALVGAAISGRVERVLVASGQQVSAGQPLAVLVSGDAASLRADADAADAAYIAAEQAHGRDEDLAKLGVVARREAEISHAQALSAQASARAARARAAAAGGPNAAGRLNVTSPISGVVINVQVGPGGFIAQGGPVAEVTNPARVEIVFNAPPQLAAQARSGMPLRVTGPAGEFDAVVTGVAANAGGESGATVIRARASSAQLMPPAGSPVTGALISEGGSGVLTVPSTAVQTIEGSAVVFVQTGDGFRATPVLAGRQASGRTEILKGLNGSERIAAANAFLLKAELAKGETEHGH